MTTMYEMMQPWREDETWHIRPVEVIRETANFWMVPTDRTKWKDGESVPMVEARVAKSIHAPRFFPTPETCREWHTAFAYKRAQQCREQALMWDGRCASAKAAEVVVKP